MKKGQSVIIPIWSIHRDPQYWINPEIFDPSRFLKIRNKDRQQQGTYIPFGIGPRSCIGNHTNFVFETFKVNF